MFPTIIKGLRGSDTSIEIVTQLTLETIRMGVRNYYVRDSTVYIFVTESISPQDKNPRLKRIEYTDADILECKIATFFRSVLRIGKVETFMNYNAERVIAKMEQLEKEAIKFEERNKDP